MELKSKLMKYRDITLQIISSLEKKEYDNIDKLIEKRQEVINDIEKSNYTNKEFKQICNVFKLPLLEQKLGKLMNEKRSHLKRQIDKISVSRNMNKSYNKKNAVDSIYFNRKM